MARKDQTQDAPADEAAPETAIETAAAKGADEDPDGYRRTRRQQLQGEPAPKDDKKAAPSKPASGYDAFMEEHWESWLKPVLGLVVLALGYMGYKWEVLPEYTAGLLLSGGVVALTIYSTAEPAYNLIRQQRYQALFLGLCLVWGFSAGFPTIRKAYPRQVLGETTLLEEEKPVVVKLKGPYAGPYDLTVSADLESTGAQDVRAGYDLTVTGAESKTEQVSGEMEVAVHQTRSRRGGGSHWTENNNQIVQRLGPEIKGTELTFKADALDKLMSKGLHVAIHPQSLNPWLFWGLGLGVILLMCLVEASIGDAKEKTNLVMAAATTLVFSYRYYDHATSTNLVRPAVEAFFLAIIIGGIGGTGVGWLVRRLSGRDKVKPSKDKDAPEK